VTGRAAELGAARNRLELMATENLSVAAAFDLSYADLTGDQQRLFRRLGLHPGAEVDGYTAAALDGTGLAAASRGLEGLYDQYLLSEPAARRYRMHDLIREYARALAGRADADRDQATERLLEYYQYTAARADALITRQARPAPAAAEGPVPAAVPPWPTGCRRWPGPAPWAEAITRPQAAIQAARHLGDRLGQANALHDLRAVRPLTDDYLAAVRAQEQALGIYRDLGDRLGQVNALHDLGGGAVDNR
jgi:hypothetical protein